MTTLKKLKKTTPISCGLFSISKHCICRLKWRQLFSSYSYLSSEKIKNINIEYDVCLSPSACHLCFQCLHSCYSFLVEQMEDLLSLSLFLSFFVSLVSQWIELIICACGWWRQSSLFDRSLSTSVNDRSNYRSCWNLLTTNKRKKWRLDKKILRSMNNHTSRRSNQ